jgi:type III restriction enzyme
MLLKTFQVNVLDTVTVFAKGLATAQQNQQKFEQFAAAQGMSRPQDKVGHETWESLRLKGRLPPGAPQWLERRDPLGREIYAACLKVPTGGGKTVIGAHAVGRLMDSLYGRKSGLVVWFVPSEAIYTQTLKAFTKPGHPYRLALETAANGRLKVFDKRSQISKNDLDSCLCVLVVMLQATVREKSDVLRVFRDSGAFHGLFPSVEDQAGNDALSKAVGNLDLLSAGEKGIPGVSVRHSLANVLRCQRPLFVIDEGHRAYSELAWQALNDLNPSFILELTATPNAIGHQSNVLASVSGVELKEAELIKLPINLKTLIGQKWQLAVKSAADIRDDLESAAKADRPHTGRYIRPIVVIRVEATGTRSHGEASSKRIHVDDVKQYLTSTLRVSESWIRLKTATVNEIADEDLVDSSCPVRFILTKDALREGWDCPFAYVLVVLNAKTGKTAITQMTGRVLRQPFARIAGDPKLNESYVVCVTEDVEHSVNAVCAGLEQEGMTDARAFVKAGAAIPDSWISVKRSSVLKDEFLLPVVAIKSGQAWVPFHPERDLWPRLDWKAISLPDVSKFVPSREERTSEVSVGLRSVNGQLAFAYGAQQVRALEPTADAYAPAVEALRSVIPNSWLAYDFIRAAEGKRGAAGVKTEQFAADRMDLARFLVAQLEPVVDDLLKAKYLELCQAGTLKFVACAKTGFGAPVPNSVEILRSSSDAPLRHANGNPLAKNAFSNTYKSEVNDLELGALRAMDASAATYWWWRVPVRGAWGLQGWRRDAVYPDFVAFANVNGQDCLLAIETKGAHLAGNDDTNYKSALLAALQSNYQGTAGVPTGDKRAPSAVAPVFKGLLLVQQANQQTNLAEVLPPPPAAATPPAPTPGSGGTRRHRSDPTGRKS